MTLIALTLGLIALQPAQVAVPNPNEAVLQNALSQMSQQPSLYLQLNGSITFHNKVTPLITNLAWSNSTVGTTQLLQVDIETYVNGVETKRIVGDGNTLWNYDLSLHQYSATSYGGTPGLARPEYYLQNLLSDLNGAATGNDGYLTKLLRQIYTQPVSNYTSWMPGVTCYQLPQGGYPVADPVNPDRTYYPSASDDYYLYNASPKRTIVFEIAPGVSNNANGQGVSGLENVYFNQLETVTRYPRLVQWVITPYTGFTFATTLFEPYSGQDVKGWKMVVAPKPVSH